LVSRDSTKMDIESFKIHPDYQAEGFRNDICLIRLKAEVEYSENIFPICFTEDDVNVGEHGFIAGWGLTSEGGFQSPELREAVVPVSDLAQCNRQS